VTIFKVHANRFKIILDNVLCFIDVLFEEQNDLNVKKNLNYKISNLITLIFLKNCVEINVQRFV